VRIATWNVNGLRARHDFLLHWLKTREPDLVALQELKLPDAQFPHDVFAQAGYHALVHGQKSWNGVAVLARKPLAPVQIGLPGQEEMGARLLAAEVEGLVFASLYCPNGKHTGHDDFAKKLAWYDTLAAHLAAALTRCADLPTSLVRCDEATRAGRSSTPTRARALRRLLALGFVTCSARALQAFSWWDYRGGEFHRRQGLRIDFLLASEAAAARVRSVEIDREWRKKQAELTPSDHAPVVAELS
jgi:exodeoxyribonuclease-3